MPTGVIINALSIALGGLLGVFVGGRLTRDFKEKTNMVFGCCSMGMGIASIPAMENMPAVIFSVVVGTMLGLAPRAFSFSSGQPPGSSKAARRRLRGRRRSW